MNRKVEMTKLLQAHFEYFMMQLSDVRDRDKEIFDKLIWKYIHGLEQGLKDRNVIPDQTKAILEDRNASDKS